MKQSIAFVFLSYLNLFCQIEAQLRPGGAHVCQRTITYNAYESRQFTRVGYENYRTCCRRVLRVCTSRCTRSRSKIVHYTNSVLIQKQRIQYYCCAGWAISGDQCPLPICNPGCKNGKCTNPNVCSCNRGFVGNLCETDINECTTKPCDQICTNLPGTYSCSCRTGYTKTIPTDTKSKSCKDVDECKTSPCKCAPNTPGCSTTCHNSIGSFTCSCNSGFQLTTSKQTCVDINECSSSATNNCQQQCINSPGTYTCSCKSGFLLLRDKRSCKDIDECSTLNGGCSQICTNQLGSYQCSCKRGFRLSNDKKTCVDINECTEQKPCDNKNGVCTNIRGSYQCSCKVGYKMLPDKKTCKDIDECKEAHSCQHNCTNTDGSYLCSCALGFRLHADRSRCDDIDECNEGTDKCQHRCHNTIGSYTCSCRAGYKRENDKISCQALPCQTVSPPAFGKMNCSGYATDESCNISCNTGFNLDGPKTRKCQPSTIWSGDEPKCERKQCPKLRPPMHGSVLLPCNEVFDAVCLKKCSRGFYMQGERKTKCIMKTDSTVWTNRNTTCIATRPCSPNPCLHDGKCTETSKTEFLCDCDGTGYTGTTCSIGIIKVSMFPQLSRNVTSPDCYVVARPAENLVIKLINVEGSLIFTPDIMHIRYPETSTKFTVKASKIGIFKISYRLLGESSSVYKSPPENIVYVFESESTRNVVDAPIDFFKNMCPNDKRVNTFTISSTCGWNSFGTGGFVSLKKDDIRLPLSIVGMENLQYEKDRITSANLTKAYLESKELTECMKPCNVSDHGVGFVDYMIKYKYFPTIFFYEFSSMLPYWLDISLDSTTNSYEAENMFMEIVKGHDKEKIQKCLPKSILVDMNHNYALYLPTALFNFKIMASSESIQDVNKVCFMVDLNTDTKYMMFKRNIDYTRHLKTNGIDVKTFKISSITFEPTTCGNATCEKHNVRMDAELKYFFKSFSGSVTFNGEFTNTDSTKFMIAGFSSQIEVKFYGNISMDLDAKFLGNVLSINTKSMETNSTISFQGETSKVVSVMPLTESNFKYTVSSIRFLPKTPSIIDIPLQVNGGLVTNIRNINMMQLLLRSSTFIRTAITKIENLLVTKYPREYQILYKRKVKLFLHIGKVSKIINKNPVDIQNATLAMKDLKLAFYDTRSLIQFMMAFFQNIDATDIVKQCRIADGLMNKDSMLQVIPNRTLASLTDTDWYLKYTGDICIYSLCFENVNIKARYPSDAGMGNITVESKFRENRNLSKRVFVVKDNTLILQINKNKNSIQGYFNASVKLFGHFHRTKILLTESKLHFQVQISFQNNLKFTVQNVKDITKVTWDDVISQITGWSLGDNKNLQDYIQNYYQETSTTTKRRLNRVKKRKEETSQKYSNFIKRFSIMKTTLQEDMKLYRVAQATYKQNLIKLNGSQIRMLSYMKSLGPTFIEKNLTGICTMKTCEKQCIAMPECQVCQDEVTVPVKVLKCDQRNENIKSSVMVPVETMCDLTKYFFIPIYTGDCEEDPAMANYRSQQMKEYIGTVQRGSTVGALIGSIIPGIGTVLGGFIGGIVGAIGGLFSSCDESYEVITKKKVIQTPCTLTKLQVQTVQRPVSTCYYIQRNIKSGYSEPKECNCKLNDCITRVAQTSCLVANMNCQNRRSLFLKSVSTIPKAFTDLHELVQKQKNNVQISFTDLQRLTKRKEFTQHEYDRIHGMLKNSKQESLFANTTESSVQNLISKDVCLAKKYDVESKIKNLFEIRSLSFEGTVPFVDNIQINAAVYVISTKTTTNISFVYDLNDGHLSLQAAAKRIIHSVLCSKSRRQRSVAQYDQSDDNSFTSWYIDENLNATTVQLACMTFEKTTSFLQDTLKYLINITKQAIKLKRYINQSSFDVSAVNVKSADSVTKSIATFFNSLQSEIGTYANRSTVSYVLTQWKETSEIFTLNNNFTVCFGFQDCVESAFYSLEKLPTILSSPRQTYDNDVCVLHVMWMAMFMKSIQNSTLSILLEHSLDMKNRLSILQKMSHHCDDPPVFVKKNLIEEDIHAKIGSKFTLKCGDITSSLPVKYNWKLHDQFLDEEASQTLEIDATLEKRGVYTCVVSSPVGSVSSKGVFVDVYQTPVFVSEMKDIVLYLPIGNDTEAYFTCNVTSSPRANIYWYHQNYEMSSPPVLLESNKSVLSLEMFDVTKSGFYYCKANNTHGEIMSNKSKLDVLKTVLPKHVLKMSVDVMEVTRNSITVPLNSITKGDFKPLAEKIRMSEQQQLHMQMERHDLKIKLAFEIQVESTAISSNSSISSLLKASSKSRQDLANSAAALVIMILQNQSTFAYDDNVTAVKLDNNSLTYELKLNICLPGYELHKNGFLCGQCRAGWYSPLGGKCTKCSEGKYQSSQGKTKCLECTDGRTTSQEGSMNKYDCELTDTASKFSKKEKIALIVSLVLLCIIFIFVGLYIWYRRKSEKKTLKIVSSENRENDEPSVRRNPIYDVSYQAQTILSNTSPCDNEAVGKVYLKDCEEKKSTEDVKCYENTLFTT